MIPKALGSFQIARIASAAPKKACTENQGDLAGEKEGKKDDKDKKEGKNKKDGKDNGGTTEETNSV